MNSFSRQSLIQRQQARREAALVGARFTPMYQGRRAFEADFSPVMCPFILDTEPWWGWMAGWRTGYDRRFQ